jgi:hypothetical protein
MSKSKGLPYGPALTKLMAEKTKVLSQALAFAQMGLPETAQPLWRMAGSLEERIAPYLDAIGHNREAAVHRISAAICYRNAGEPSRAANLFQAALAGPLKEDSRADVERLLEECLGELVPSVSSQATITVS